MSQAIVAIISVAIFAYIAGMANGLLVGYDIGMRAGAGDYSATAERVIASARRGAIRRMRNN